MADVTILPAVAQMSDEDRVKWLERVHPDYKAFKRTWQILLDAYDGTGGFLNGDYIWQFPRESQAAYIRRSEQARYHNYVETLVDLYCRYLYAQPVHRSTTDHGLQAWWENVDGHGTSISAWMRDALAEALASGHCGVLMDKLPVPAAGPSKADEVAREPYLARYAPLDIRDWYVDRDVLQCVKIAEHQPPDPNDPKQEPTITYLLWDTTGWARYDAKGAFLAGADMPLPAPPLVLIRPKMSHRYQWIGKPLINANVVLALYNRGSEEDVVLRDQAFSLFVVSVPPNADEGTVEKVKQQIGGDVGTTSAMVVQGTATYETPDTSVPPMIRDSAAYCVREIWRSAHLRFERDGLQKESAEAIRLQNAELNQALNGIAAELRRVELALARWYFAWTTPDSASAIRAYDAANVVIEYPREFFAGDLLTELQAWAEGLKFGLGPTFEQRTKMRVLHKLEPDLDQETRDKIESEIKTAPSRIDGAASAAPGGSALNPDDLRQRAAARLAAFGATEAQA